jgi:hypothetical protein
MDDPNVFAVLTAHDTRNKATTAFKLVHNAKWFRPAVGGVAEQATISSREPTPAVDAQAEGVHSSGAVDRLVLTFSELMKLDGLGEGIQTGTSTATSRTYINMFNSISGCLGSLGVSGILGFGSLGSLGSLGESRESLRVCSQFTPRDDLNRHEMTDVAEQTSS